MKLLIGSIIIAHIIILTLYYYLIIKPVDKEQTESLNDVRDTPL